MISTADAPSVICEELPAVTLPSSLKAGFRLASVSTDGVGSDALVGGHELVGRVALVVAHVDRHDLALEAALGGRLGRAAVALGGERVEVLARDAPLVGDHLGADALVLQSADRLVARRDARTEGPTRVLADRRAHGHARS